MSKTKLALSTAAFAMALAVASPANALVTFTAQPGSATYSGPTPTYDFDTSTPTLNPPPGPGYGVVTNDPGTHALPLGGSGQFLSAGPSTTEPQTVFLNGLGNIYNLSFIWGSLDNYNHITFTDATGTAIPGLGYTFSGLD